jgi:hypothetical protein
VTDTSRAILAALAALAAIAALLPAAASARRDDPPSEPFKPTDGAVVPNATKGLKIDFSCPRYHTDEGELSLTGPGEGYTLTLSRLPDVDQYGALTAAGIVDQRPVVPLLKVPGHCESELNTRGEALLPLEPGTYYWQSSRICATYVCPGGIEVSFVSRVTVKKTVCSSLRAQSRATSSKLKAARRRLRRAPRSHARRAEVSRLSNKLRIVRERLRVVYACAR